MPRISTNTSGKSLALGTWLAGSTSWFAAVVLGWNFFSEWKAGNVYTVKPWDWL